MLKPAWYLPDTDWFTQQPHARRLSDDAQTVIGQLAQMLTDEGPLEPAVTSAATHVMLLAVQHLEDTMAHGAACHDLTEVARLLCGLHLAQAYLTQTLQQIAAHTDARAFPGTADAPAEVVKALSDSLRAAGSSGELLAGHLTQAHLILRSLTT